MSLPVTTTITGMDKPEIVEHHLRVAQNFQPMSAAGDAGACATACVRIAADARFEPYKVSLKFDNPEARLAHEFPLDMQQKEVKEMLGASREHRQTVSEVQPATAAVTMPMANRLSRRSFLQTAALTHRRTGHGATACASIPKRPLGRTGLEVSCMGLGGYHLGTVKDQQTVDRIVDEAIDAGINFFDNAWEYHDGRSEEVVGQALAGKRDKVDRDDQGLHART